MSARRACASVWRSGLDLGGRGDQRGGQRLARVRRPWRLRRAAAGGGAGALPKPLFPSGGFLLPPDAIDPTRKDSKSWNFISLTLCSRPRSPRPDPSLLSPRPIRALPCRAGGPLRRPEVGTGTPSTPFAPPSPCPDPSGPSFRQIGPGGSSKLA